MFHRAVEKIGENEIDKVVEKWVKRDRKTLYIF